jgi:hypothetical protein
MRNMDMGEKKGISISFERVKWRIGATTIVVLSEMVEENFVHKKRFSTQIYPRSSIGKISTGLSRCHMLNR